MTISWLEFASESEKWEASADSGIEVGGGVRAGIEEGSLSLPSGVWAGCGGGAGGGLIGSDGAEAFTIS